MLFDMRSYRKTLYPLWLLKHGRSPIVDQVQTKSRWHWLLYACIVLAILWLLCGCEPLAWSYTLDQYADAIKHAEGNSNYGILAHYKHTTYRQACKNTVKHADRQWHRNGRKGLFLTFLANKYCPIGSNTDNDTCKYWAGNVSYWLRKG